MKRICRQNLQSNASLTRFQRRELQWIIISAFKSVLICVICGLVLCGFSPPVEKITDHLYRVGGALVDTKARTVTCRGEIGMDQGSVEYLAVTPKGKTYESLLQIEVRPLHLQVALLLLGLEPKNVLTRQGDHATPKGAPLELTVRWRDHLGAEREVRAEELLVQGPRRTPMSRHAWVFTGSRILKEGFEADLSGSLAAIWHDPAALLDNPLRGGDNDWEVNPARTPKRGTPIELILHAVELKTEQKSAPVAVGGGKH